MENEREVLAGGERPERDLRLRPQSLSRPCTAPTLKSIRARPSVWWANPAPARPPSAGPSAHPAHLRRRDPYKGQKINGKISRAGQAGHQGDPDDLPGPAVLPERARQGELHRGRGPAERPARPLPPPSGRKRSGRRCWMWACCRSLPPASPTSSRAASASASALPAP